MQAKLDFVAIDQLAKYIGNKVSRCRKAVAAAWINALAPSPSRQLREDEDAWAEVPALLHAPRFSFAVLLMELMWFTASTCDTDSEHQGEQFPTLCLEAAQRLFDILAVVTTVGPLGSIKRKSDQSELIRRDVTLLDSTCEITALACTSSPPSYIPPWTRAGQLLELPRLLQDTNAQAMLPCERTGRHCAARVCRGWRRAKTVRATLWGRLAEEQGSALEVAAADAPIVAISSCRATDFDGVLGLAYG